MMHGRGKSDPVIVAVKPTNQAERSAAESVEPRAGTKGNAGQQSAFRTQSRASACVPTATGGSSSRCSAERLGGRWPPARSSRRYR